MKLTMIGRLIEGLILMYSTPEEAVAHLLPKGLRPVTFKGQAFWNIVLSKIDAMRPPGVPEWAGVNYNHVAYRLNVHARTVSDQELTGLYFLRSDVDNGLMARIGDRLTDFQFNTAQIKFEIAPRHISIDISNTRAKRGDAIVEVALGQQTLSVPSPLFENLAERDDLLKYQPLGLSIGKKDRIKLVEVIRDEEAWLETPVGVESARWNYLEHLGQDKLYLERAFRIAPIEYKWRLGRWVATNASIPAS